MHMYTCIERNVGSRYNGIRWIFMSNKTTRSRERNKNKGTAKEMRGSLYNDRRGRMRFYNCAGCELIAELIGMVVRVMCFQHGAAFCARSCRSCSKCEMDFERSRSAGTFHNEKISIGHLSCITNFSRPKLVILMSSSMCKRKPRSARPPNEN